MEEETTTVPEEEGKKPKGISFEEFRKNVEAERNKLLPGYLLPNVNSAWNFPAKHKKKRTRKKPLPRESPVLPSFTLDEIEQAMSEIERNSK